AAVLTARPSCSPDPEGVLGMSMFSQLNMTRRPRRLRRNETIRRLVRETAVTTDDLLYPMFVTEESESREIPSMPGVFRFTVDDLCREVEKVAEVGIPAIMLFGIPQE